VDEHRFTEIGDDALGAQPAGFIFVRIAALAAEQLLVMKSDAAAADPILSITDVDVIEVRQRLRSLARST